MTCYPAPASLPADQVYANLTNVIASIGFDAFGVFEATSPDSTHELPFYQNCQLHFLTVCWAFDGTKKTLAPASPVQPSQIGVSTELRVLRYSWSL